MFHDHSQDLEDTILQFLSHFGTGKTDRPKTENFGFQTTPYLYFYPNKLYKYEYLYIYIYSLIQLN